MVANGIQIVIIITDWKNVIFEQILIKVQQCYVKSTLHGKIFGSSLNLSLPRKVY